MERENRGDEHVVERAGKRKDRDVSETYQYWGKLSLSSSHQRSSSQSLSRGFDSLWLFPSFPTVWGVVLRVMGAGLDDLCLVETSETVTAFLTSVMEVFAEP
jgi:hypothetical protein